MAWYRLIFFCMFIGSINQSRINQSWICFYREYFLLDICSCPFGDSKKQSTMANIITSFVPLGITIKDVPKYASPLSNKIPIARIVGVMAGSGMRMSFEGSQRDMARFLSSRSADNSQSSILYKKLTIGNTIRVNDGSYRITPQSRILVEAVVSNVKASYETCLKMFYDVMLCISEWMVF